MEYFVDKNSIVRQIWGKSDTILLIFAGAAAEFALNKAVDWLYFTGRLPADPLGRLFSTVSYARSIVFSEKQSALRTIDAIAAIHAGVEEKRGASIPDSAYRDVLFMLIDYSIRSFELLERELNSSEKQEVFDVFYKVANRMGVEGLPHDFAAWERMRQEQINENLVYSHFTKNLFHQYRKHLGLLRYKILLEVQAEVLPQTVRGLLGLSSLLPFSPLIGIVKLSTRMKFDWLLKALILPTNYKKDIRALDREPVMP